MSITLTFTTCKRLYCFLKTADCLKKYCTDFDTIEKVLIVDDSSKQSDRDEMINAFPTWQLLTHECRSHSKSLNIIRENVTTDYVLMFEDDWECTREFSIQEILMCMKEYGLLYLNLTNNFQRKIIGKFKDQNITQMCFDLKKLDLYCFPIYRDWINNKKYLRSLLEKIEVEQDEYTCHWPCYGLQPSLVSANLLKKYAFDESEKSSFIELSYGIDHVIDGTVKYFGSVNLGIKHLESISSYVLNGTRRWWDLKLMPTLVTMYLNIGRDNRPKEHYIDSLKKILETPNPKVIFWDSEYINMLPHTGQNVKVVPISKDFKYFEKVLEIIKKPEFKNQAEYLNNPNGDEYLAKYMCTTFLKHELLQKVVEENPFESNEIYWIDCGIHSSFNIQKQVQVFDKNPNGLFITTFPYWVNNEIHGLNKEYIFQKIKYQNRVTRASFFGGKFEHIKKFSTLIENLIEDSIQCGFIGTEESYYTIACHQHPELFDIYNLPTGDIGYLFQGEYDFVEIGVSDFEYEIDPNKKGIFIEPVSEYYNSIQCTGYNKTKIQAAVTFNKTSEICNVYHIPSDIIHEHGFPNWLRGCNTINEFHPQTEPYKEHVKIDTVTVLNIEELFEKYNIQTIKYLKIDTEGHDCTILDGLFKTNVRPKKIRFESNLLTPVERVDETISKAISVGYTVAERSNDTILIFSQK